MAPELWWLVVATAVFLLLHTVVSSTGLRGWLVGVMGEGPYLGLFSLAVTGTLVWMSLAYASAPYIELWEAPRALRLVALAVMAPVVMLLAAGVAQPSPTGVGGAGKAIQWEARGILRITRHPLQWAILIWAILHVLVNGDLASLLFFGGLALLAAAGPMLIDRKRSRAMGERWERFAATTSNLPFAAIITGRTRFAPGEIGWKSPALGVVLYITLVSAHPYVIGVGAY